MKAKHNMSRNNSSIVFPVVLKTIISHTHRDDKAFAKNDKQVRATLRAKGVNNHIRNTSWIATNMREYDAIRTAYDAAYAARIAKPAKAPRVKKAEQVNVEA